jgi:hypothetical protein
MEPVPERLYWKQCADLLGMGRGELRAHRNSLAQCAAGEDERGPYWQAEDVYRWAARTLPGICSRIPVTFWPQATAPARYLGTRAIGTYAAALGWATQCGDLWVAWDYPSNLEKTLAATLSQFSSAAAVTAIGGDFGRSGPAVWAVLPASPNRAKYEMPWRVLSSVLGQPVPYWPFPLRIPELIQAWRPGVVPAVSRFHPG